MSEQPAKIDPRYNPNYVARVHKLEQRVNYSGTVLQLHMNSFTPEECNDWTTLRHSNADYELHILLNGAVSLEADRSVLSMGIGDGILIAPGCLHYPFDVSQDVCRFTLRFLPQPGSHMYQQLREKVHGFVRFSCTQKQLYLCRGILEEYCAQQAFMPEALNGLYLQLLTQIFRCIGLTPEKEAPSAEYQTNQERVIMDRFFFPWPYTYGNQTDLAQLLHVSLRQLNRILQENYGMSFRQKMLQSRMEYAGCLLQSTDERIVAIGTQVGYKEESSFFKAFQNYYGMTPQQYRQRVQSTERPREDTGCE